jgi:cobalt-zinc-cadmium efflux system outer membrane protein
MHFRSHSGAAVVAILALSGCASLPRERGYAEASALVQARRDAAPLIDPEATSVAPDLPTEPLSPQQAVRLAFLYNPRIREEYARLGLGRAELEETRRLSNPTFGYARLTPRDGTGSQITRSVSWGFADLLLWPARKRFATGELERLQQAVAAALLELATEVEVAWYEAVGAQQVAAMRDVVAQAAERSAELAQRFFDAGNITRLQLEQEYAAASQARIAAVRAGAAAVRARSELAGLIGLPNDAAWTTQTQLAAPPASALSVDALVPLALEQRLDLAAAQKEVALREDALGVTRRWRWLGAIELGYERESEIDGAVLRGPSLSLQLPIFNQGQAAMARAQAELLDARARRDALVLSVQNAARLGIEREAVSRDIAERYRTALVPRREAIVARTQERVNYMLQGVFELILARQQEYDAYQEYLEAVRDYWTARAELRGVAGGRLPDDGAPLEPALGVDAILPPEEAPAMDHSRHGGAMSVPAPSAADPHAGHRMPSPNRDPHAGHAMPTAPSTPASDAPDDPHAGHAMPPASPPKVDPSTDPHAGHAMPPTNDDAPEPTDDDTHDHGDTP